MKTDLNPDKELEFGSIYNIESKFVDSKVQQSMIDPTKSQVLLNYNLDSFKNSIWENFLGSHVQISKIVEKEGNFKITNRLTTKLGPIQLQTEHESLYNAWENSRVSVIKDFKGLAAD